MLSLSTSPAHSLLPASITESPSCSPLRMPLFIQPLQCPFGGLQINGEDVLSSYLEALPWPWPSASCACSTKHPASAFPSAQMASSVSSSSTMLCTARRGDPCPGYFPPRSFLSELEVREWHLLPFRTGRSTSSLACRLRMLSLGFMATIMSSLLGSVSLRFVWLSSTTWRPQITLWRKWPSHSATRLSCMRMTRLWHRLTCQERFL